jgi:acyl-CoA synthetase (AMP-forming)/AMP-acid ligase II
VADTTGNYVRRALDLFAAYGDAEALVAPDGRRFSFTDLRARVRNTAAALWGHGIRPGMTIGMLVTNTAESLFVQLAAHLLGCRTVFAMRVAPPPFLRGLLEFADADAFIYETGMCGEVGRELALAAAPLPTLCIGTGGVGPDLTDPSDVDELPFDPGEVTAEPESLFQTSGTTGTPKLVRYGQRFFHAIPKVAEFYQPPDQPRIRHLSLAGTWHSGGQSAALMTWFSGGLLVTAFNLDVAGTLAVVERERITSINVSPPALYQILDDPALTDADLSSVRYVTVCCAPATPARLRQAHEWFGPALNIVYGMSEIPIITAFPDVAGDPAHPGRLASCGRPWGDARVEIRDASGAGLPTGEAGEIWVRGELVMEEYWKQPDLNAENLVDGWLRTGDVGRFDEDGYLYILDRVSDMIVTEVSSFNVFCRPLEDALAEHPEVRQAAVIGVPDEFLGEAVHAYVIRTPGATVTPEELRRHVVDRLNASWSPREVEFLDAFPLNESRKVDKKALRAYHVTRTADLAPADPG